MRLLVTTLALAIGCGGHSVDSTAPGTQASVLAPAPAPLSTSTEAAAAEPEQKAPPGAPEGPGVAIARDWVASDPRLTTLLLAATPACVSKETFLHTSDGTLAYSYDVYAPSLAQDEIERRFRDAAQKLGYAVSKRPLLGLGFDDPARIVGATVSPSRVTVILGGATWGRESVSRLATAVKLEIWSLIEEIGADARWRSITIERYAGGGAALQAELIASNVKRVGGAVDSWARSRNLGNDSEGWVRKLDEARPDVSGIVLDYDKDGALNIHEGRGSLSGPACASPPTEASEDDRNLKDAPPSKPDKKAQEKQDDLFREMMRK